MDNLFNNLVRVNFNEGVNLIINKICESNKNPYLVLIHGIPNSGKTYLRRNLHETARLHNKTGWMGMVGDNIDRFVQYPKGPDYFIMEDVFFSYGVFDYTVGNFGKKPDLNIHIAKYFDNYDHKNHIGFGLEKQVDLFIENPNSQIK